MTIAEGGGVATWTPTASVKTGTGRELEAVKATFRTEDLGPLRAALQSALQPAAGSGGATPSVVVLLNPTADAAPSQCTPGVGHACVITHQRSEALGWSVLSLQPQAVRIAGAFFPKPPLGAIGTDALWSPTETGFQTLVLGGPEGRFAVDLTRFGADGQVDPGGPWAKINEYLTGGGATSIDNLRARVVLRPELLAFRTWLTRAFSVKTPEAGPFGASSNPYEETAGLWMPAYIEFENLPSMVHWCAGKGSAPASGSLPDDGCAQVMHSVREALSDVPIGLGECNKVGVTVDLHRLDFAIGLVPNIDYAGCFGQHVGQPWAASLPDGRPFLGCLRVEPHISLAPRVEWGKPGPTYDEIDGDSPPPAVQLRDLRVQCSGLVGVGWSAGSALGPLEDDVALRVQLEIGATFQTRFDGLAMAPFAIQTQYFGGGPADAPDPSKCSVDLLTPRACTPGPDEAACHAHNQAGAECRRLMVESYFPATFSRITTGWFSDVVGATRMQIAGISWAKDGCSTLYSDSGARYIGGHTGGYCGDAHVCPEGCRYNDYEGNCVKKTGPASQSYCGLPVAYPALPGSGGLVMEMVAVPDVDGDGVDNAHDNCLWTENPNQADWDADGRGNACDTCVCDATNDADGDSICAVCDPSSSLTGCFGGCSTHKEQADNCAVVPNPLQTNTNLEVEVVRSAERLGDACEPVPQPDFLPVYDESPVADAPCDSVGSDFERCPWQRTLVSVSFTPLGSRGRGEGGERGAPEAAGQLRAVTVPTTDLRYCNGDLGEGLPRCRLPANIADQHALVPLGLEETGTVWRRVSTTQGGVAVDRALGALGSREYPATGEQVEWRWAADAGSWGVAPPSRGRLWLHANTLVGLKGGESHPVTLANGLHFYLPDAPIKGHAEGLANVYKDVEAKSFFSRINSYSRRAPLTFEVHRFCLACLRPDLDLERDPWLEALERRPGGVAMTVVGDSVAYLVGREVVLHGSATPAARRALGAAGAVRVASSDPNPLAGKGPSQPETLVLGDRGAITARLFFTAAGISTDADAVRQAPGDVAVLAPSGGDTPTDTTAVSTLLPEGTTGMTYVFSGRDAAVYSVGGQRGEQPTGEVWRAHLDGGTTTWRQMELFGVRPARVVASTYQPAAGGAHEGRLWILDEVGRGWARRQRLLTVDVATGEVVRLAEWPRLGVFDQRFLTLDRDDGVLLSVSSRLLGVHAVFRVAASSRGSVAHLEATPVRFERGWLAGPPVVDASGYALLVQSRPRELPLVVHATALGLGQRGDGGFVHPGDCQ